MPGKGVSQVTLFWRLTPAQQALLMQFQWDAHGERLEIPTPPATSEAVWQVVLSETTEEFAKVMRQKPHPGPGGYRP